MNAASDGTELLVNGLANQPLLIVERFMQNYPLPAQNLVASMVEAAASRPQEAVAFQGAPGCNGHNAVRNLFPEAAALPCYSFEEAIDAVIETRASRAVIPVENALNGRVADIHFLLPESGLSITDEYFLPIKHALMKCTGALEATEVISHPQALGQCRRTLKQRGLVPVTYIDTAAAAAHVSELGDPRLAALAPAIAAQLYGLEIVESDLSDFPENVTRFLVLEKEARATAGDGPWLTSLHFSVRSVPAALFKALTGFATNGVNMTKLESYQAPGRFTASQFYCDIEGHPDDAAVTEALRDLDLHCDWVRTLGTYPSRRSDR